MSLFLEWPDWTVPSTVPPAGDVVALDWETMDPTLKSHGSAWAYKGVGEGLGLALTTEHTSTYYPIRHAESNIEIWPQLRAWLEDFVSKPTNTLVMFNALYDLGWLLREGIEVRCRIVDPGAAVALLDESRWSYSLDACAKTYIKSEKVDLRSLSDALGVSDIWTKLKKVHPALISSYAERDGRLTWDLWKVVEGKLRAEDLTGIFNLEMDLVPVLLDMRRRGVRVDVARAEMEEARLKQVEADHKTEIKRLTGLSCDVWSSGSVEGVLLEAGLVPPRTASGGASITAPWLTEQAKKHEVPKLILEARRANKLHSMYMRSYILEHQIDGRIHATFSPLRSDEGGAVTGRFSSSDPNLQNLSARNPESAKTVRGCFLPEEGDEWASVDWSAQEPRLTVHFAALLEKVQDRRVAARLTGAGDTAAEYHRNPRLDFHQFVADLAGIKRRQAKDINLGLAYGLGEVKLCKQLGYETVHDPDKGREVAGPEGRALIDRYHERLPWMRGIMKTCEEMAETRGYIRTLLGRKRRFLMRGQSSDKNHRKAYAYKALNALIQGSAADQMKKAMVETHRAGIPILVTLHDELAMSVKDRQMAAHAAEIMCDCVKLQVPMSVDIEVGPNWGDCT